MSDSELDGWMRFHGGKIVETTLQPVYDNRYNAPDSSSDSLVYRTEPVYTIRISAKDLANLHQFEKRVFGNIRHEYEHFELFNRMMDDQEKERNLRNRNESVRQAYEHYKLMMALASESK